MKISILLFTLLMLYCTTYAATVSIDPRLMSSQRPTTVENATIFSANGKDPRRYLSFKGAGKKYAMIGRVFANQALPIKDFETGQISMFDDMAGTGFIISPCIFVTAHHIVFGKAKNPNTKDFSVTFQSTKKAVGRPILWGPKEKTDHPRDDWALVAFDPGHCIGLDVGFMLSPYAFGSELKDKKLFTAGYPADLNVDQSIRLYISETQTQKDHLNMGDGVLLASGATSGGNSGGPVFYEEKGQLYYVGIHVNGYEKTLKKYDPSFANGYVAGWTIWAANSAVIKEDFDKHSEWLVRHKLSSEPGADPRRYQAYEAVNSKYAPIGRVINNQKSFKAEDSGTGFLVSPCYFVTNYRSVFGDSKRPTANDFSVTFRSTRTAVGLPVLWGPFDKTTAPGDDWVLLQFEPKSCIGDEVGWLDTGLMIGPVDRTEAKLKIAGFPIDKNKLAENNDLYVNDNVQIINPADIHPSYFLTTGAGRPNSPGSPIYFEEGGRLRYVGMYSGVTLAYPTIFGPDNFKFANVGVDYMSFLSGPSFKLIFADWKKAKK